MENTYSIAKQSNFIEITLWYGCSEVNLLHIFRTPFPRNTSRWLLLLLAFLGPQPLAPYVGPLALGSSVPQPQNIFKCCF